MGYAVELNLSPTGAARVVVLWEALARASINSTMLDLGARPHISLAVFEDSDPAALRDGVEAFAQSTAPLSLVVSAVGAFPTAEGVMFLAPSISQELLEAHARFHRFLSDRGLDCVPHYRPGMWVPHCTVALGVAPERLGAAQELCLKSEAFGPVELDAVSLVEWFPLREVCAFPLSGR